jgi:hypothetical protein
MTNRPYALFNFSDQAANGGGSHARFQRLLQTVKPLVLLEIIVA